ncbi:hypothetical protein HMPREF9136_0687 [Prevotella dentalis DSM 3688]|uniref:Uncharacterized protein n=1 Tax=Prevotella dentalis (strain ATCC 49559 / DSM 3688 / JCM 13448 / NCTC 12043 / ES 2772) TaxID=908937 RepID=F9D1F9_PREDD|nr:hypothetical protein HMPREF9136_0687 [Prevotella dentalis DSM 3688]
MLRTLMSLYDVQYQKLGFGRKGSDKNRNTQEKWQLLRAILP